VPSTLPGSVSDDPLDDGAMGLLAGRRVRLADHLG